MTAGELRTIIQKRTRDPEPRANTPAIIRQVSSEAQRLVNAANKLVLKRAPLPTIAGQAVYAANFDNAVRVEFVEDSLGRNLSKVSLASLVNYSRTWFVDVGPRFEAFCMIGRDTLVVYPTLDRDSTVNVSYTRLLTDLVSDATPLELRDEHLNPVINLAEIVLLLKNRKLENMEAIIKQFIADLSAQNQLDRGISPVL